MTVSLNFARGTGEEVADTFLDMLTKMKEGVKEEIQKWQKAPSLGGCS